MLYLFIFTEEMLSQNLYNALFVSYLKCIIYVGNCAGWSSCDGIWFPGPYKQKILNLIPHCMYAKTNTVLPPL
jgi:hypothetical protein